MISQPVLPQPPKCWKYYQAWPKIFFSEQCKETITAVSMLFPRILILSPSYSWLFSNVYFEVRCLLYLKTCSSFSLFANVFCALNVPPEIMFYFVQKYIFSLSFGKGLWMENALKPCLSETAFCLFSFLNDCLARNKLQGSSIFFLISLKLSFHFVWASIVNLIVISL